MGEGHGRKRWMSVVHTRGKLEMCLEGIGRRSALKQPSQQVTGDEAGEVGWGRTVYWLNIYSSRM